MIILLMPVSSPAVIAVLLLLASTDRLPKSSAQHEASEHGGVSEYDIPHPDHHCQRQLICNMSPLILPQLALAVFSRTSVLWSEVRAPPDPRSAQRDNDVTRDPALTFCKIKSLDLP